MGLFSRIKRRLRPSRGKADTSSFLGVPIVTKAWMPENNVLFIYNGIDRVVRLDGTSKEVAFPVKKPRFVLVHTGKTKLMNRLPQQLSKAVSQDKPSENATAQGDPHA